MGGIKLGKLPDRTPIKLTISVLPDLKSMLDEYSIFYGETYGQAEPVTEIASAMLSTFLESDRDFVTWRKARRKVG